MFFYYYYYKAYKIQLTGSVWWHTPEMPVLGSLRQEDLVGSVPAWVMQKVQGSPDSGDFRDFISDKQNHDCTETMNIKVTVLSAVISKSQLPMGLCHFLSLQNSSVEPVSLRTTLGLITHENYAD